MVFRPLGRFPYLQGRTPPSLGLVRLLRLGERNYAPPLFSKLSGRLNLFEIYLVILKQTNSVTLLACPMSNPTATCLQVYLLT